MQWNIENNLISIENDIINVENSDLNFNGEIENLILYAMDEKDKIDFKDTEIITRFQQSCSIIKRNFN